MQCRNCGTEIADKAIICFRCGHATTDPVRKAVPIKPRRSPLVPLVLIVILAASGLYLGVESRTAANPEPFELAPAAGPEHLHDRRCDAPAIHNSAGGNDGNADGIDDLRKERHQANRSEATC